MKSEIYFRIDDPEELRALHDVFPYTSLPENKVVLTDRFSVELLRELILRVPLGEFNHVYDQRLYNIGCACSNVLEDYAVMLGEEVSK